MKKKYKILLLLIAGLAIWFVYGKYTYTFEFKNGEFYNGPVYSPSGEFAAKSYYKNYGGAAGGVNVWVEITYNDEPEETKTIYYAPGNSHFSMEWLDEDTLRIVNKSFEFPGEDRTVELQIGKEIYDESGAACNSLAMKKEYTHCYGRDTYPFN